MAPHSSTLAWKIPWMEEPGRLQSMGSLRVGHDWVTSLSLFTFMHWKRKWQPTPVFLPGESQGWGSLVGCCLRGRRVGHDWSDLAAAAAALPYYIHLVSFVRAAGSWRLSWDPGLGQGVDPRPSWQLRLHVEQIHWEWSILYGQGQGENQGRVQQLLVHPFFYEHTFLSCLSIRL